MATLRLIPASGDPIDITAEQALIGRDPGCEVVLADGSVSRKHARIERRGLVWSVVDQGSANGTFLDGQRVADAALRSGQEIRFGSTSFRVAIEGEGPEPGVTLVGVQPEVTVVKSPLAPPPAPPAPPRATTPEAPPPARPAPPPPPPPPLPPRPAAPPPRAGVARPVPPTSPVPAMEVPPAAAKKGKGPFFWIATGCVGCLGMVVLLLALIVGVFYWSTQGTADVVRQQLSEIKRGETDQAYTHLSDSHKARLSRSEFEALINAHPGMKENADSTFWSRSVDNNKARLSGFLTSASGRREPVTYELVKEGGAWKISEIQFGP